MQDAIREVILDTETTGLKVEDGGRLHRIIEIGCVEMRNKMLTGERFHRYVNPERDIPEDSFKVHGLSWEFLEDKDIFKEIAADLVGFIGEPDGIVIHNAEFDLPFINMELKRAGQGEIAKDRVVDTLVMARKKYPGQSNSLDGLCRRFGIDTNRRKNRHGAMIDAELLAEVYIDLTDSRTSSLDLVEPVAAAAATFTAGSRPEPLPSLLTAEEIARHAQLLKNFDKDAVWYQYLTKEGELKT